MGRKSTDKRARLVQSAVKLFHLEGLQATSIANIARDADVPVGNVFYYFRTKEDLVRAVVDHWLKRIDVALDSLLPDANPELRLEAFLDASASSADVYASVGCPLVGLARDLRLSDDSLAPLAGEMAARQCSLIGRLFEATGLNAADALIRARSFLATLQGSFQLAFALRDPEIVHESIAALKRHALGFEPGTR